MWYDESVMYQIYPLGFCGAPKENDGAAQNRLEKLEAWIPHIKETGFDTLYLGPVFESDRHGYDTRDFKKIDCRLGDNAMFKRLCGKLHEAGIRILLDGVFNHVGRGFWAFRDVREKRRDSPYKDWFSIDFSRNSGDNDGFWYEGWEGHYELVKLNLRNPAVTDYILECVGGWMDEFGIDGLRLDVAYALDKDFLRKLRKFVKERDKEFFLLGECLHGDYNQFVAPDLLDSCTNYECYKGLYSSFNDLNLFEIAYSLGRQFAADRGALYGNKNLLSFADNHDVTRIATILKEPRHLPLVYTLMYTMPGIPCVYYGSEWGAKGGKREGDDALRPSFESPESNEQSRYIASLSALRKNCKALAYGSYKQISLTNRQFIFRREFEGKAVVVAINADSQPFTMLTGINGTATDLLTGKECALAGAATLPPYFATVWGEGKWDVPASTGKASSIPKTPAAADSPHGSPASAAGYNTDIALQIDELKKILLLNTELYDVIKKASHAGLTDYYIGGGCIAQTVWNYLSGLDLMSGISDIDVAYFDGSDLSERAEDAVIRRITDAVQSRGVKLDIKNQARVHLWYKEHFGYDITPYESVEHAINTWPATATCVGVRLENNVLKIYAPYGLNDLFGMTVKANKAQITEEIHRQKARKWIDKWPSLTVIPW